MATLGLWSRWIPISASDGVLEFRITLRAEPVTIQARTVGCIDTFTLTDVRIPPNPAYIHSILNYLYSAMTDYDKCSLGRLMRTLRDVIQCLKVYNSPHLQMSKIKTLLTNRYGASWNSLRPV